MATRAIRPKREDTLLTGFQSMPEQAPSIVREDAPTAARVLAMAGTLFVAVGVLAMLAPSWNLRYIISPGWGFFVFTIGLMFILYHAFIDRDVQFRRLYLAAGLLLAAAGVVLRILPLGGTMGGWFLPLGISFLSLALIFLLAPLRNETDAGFRKILVNVIGILGAAMLAFGLLVGQFHQDFLLREGVLLIMLGLCYLACYIGMQDAGSDIAFSCGVALGIIGAVNLLLAWRHVFFPSGDVDFAVPSIILLTATSIVCFALFLGICSDRPFVVLVRRELAAFFYSPIAYLVMFGLLLIGVWMFWTFLDLLDDRQRGGMFEPILLRYIYSLFPVIAQMFVVAVLTMRLLSEEARTGTLEVLLTAPVNEATVVLSKFVAVWIFYLFTWLPWLLFLVALPTMGGDPFDYRPLLSFVFALMATSAGFLAMGLFFSSITRNQIIAAVLTFVGMVTHLGFHMLAQLLSQTRASDWAEVFDYVSFLDLWMRTLDGTLAPRFLVFHISSAIFFLFVTIKVLESRKWK
ncbi:MAG: ABC transporter permease [Gemmataceae bacterium]|nr:ABC transporter permease [Gemmataceae bacterium]